MKLPFRVPRWKDGWVSSFLSSDVFTASSRDPFSMQPKQGGDDVQAPKDQRFQHRIKLLIIELFVSSSFLAASLAYLVASNVLAEMSVSHCFAGGLATAFACCFVIDHTTTSTAPPEMSGGFVRQSVDRLPSLRRTQQHRLVIGRNFAFRDIQ